MYLNKYNQLTKPPYLMLLQNNGTLAMKGLPITASSKVMK